MTDCLRLSDRIPDVAHGRSRWTPEEASHLAQCAHCRAELALVHAVMGLGEQAPVPGNPSAMTSAVLARVADDRRIHRRARWAWGVGAGAAAAIVVSLWVENGGEPPSQPVAAASAEIALPELEPLETAELDSLLRAMDGPTMGWSALDQPSLGDLEPDELEQVLGTWEG
jgi:hypothetical protein